MTKKQLSTIATVFGLLGILFFMSIGFNIFPQNYATFGGIVCLMISGVVWGMTTRAS